MHVRGQREIRAYVVSPGLADHPDTRIEVLDGAVNNLRQLKEYTDVRQRVSAASSRVMVLAADRKYHGRVTRESQVPRRVPCRTRWRIRRRCR